MSYKKSACPSRAHEFTTDYLVGSGFLFSLCVLCPMLSVSLNLQFLIVPLFSPTLIYNSIFQSVHFLSIFPAYKEATELTVLGGEAEVITSNVLRLLS